ncbi:MAG: hypothetical protein LC114_12555 [Bryobacterales bacterium]|nr:hypothetical protein [Bryobacterales bacterium]
MKIAVASVDGKTVSASLRDAQGVVVFEATDNEVEFQERRKRHLGEWRQAETPAGFEKAQAAMSRTTAAHPIGESVPDDFLHEILDCSVVIAGQISPVEQAQMQRLGLLALPVATGEPAELAVRFAVNGLPLGNAQGCGCCHNKS